MDLLEKIDIFVGFDINEETEYQKFFAKKLKKAGYDSPADIPDDKKKEFFDMINKEWKAKDETD